jgi:UrcA family protein
VKPHFKEITMNTKITMSFFRTVLATAVFGTASSFAPLPAVADSFDPPQTTVKYADLNIAGREGAAVLYARIQHAAENVCLQFDWGGLDAYVQRKACIHKAVSGAVAQVNAPALTALYSAKTGTDAPVRLVSR